MVCIFFFSLLLEGKKLYPWWRLNSIFNWNAKWYLFISMYFDVEYVALNRVIWGRQCQFFSVWISDSKRFRSRIYWWWKWSCVVRFLCRKAYSAFCCNSIRSRSCRSLRVIRDRWKIWCLSNNGCDKRFVFVFCVCMVADMEFLEWIALVLYFIRIYVFYECGCEHEITLRNEFVVSWRESMCRKEEKIFCSPSMKVFCWFECLT